MINFAICRTNPTISVVIKKYFTRFTKFSIFNFPFSIFEKMWPMKVADKKIGRQRNPYLIPISMSDIFFPLRYDTPTEKTTKMIRQIRGRFRLLRYSLICFAYKIITQTTNSARIPSLRMAGSSGCAQPKIPYWTTVMRI